MSVIEDSLDEATPEAKEVIEGHAAHTKADERKGTARCDAPKDQRYDDGRRLVLHELGL